MRRDSDNEVTSTCLKTNSVKQRANLPATSMPGTAPLMECPTVPAVLFNPVNARLPAIVNMPWAGCMTSSPGPWKT